MFAPEDLEIVKGAPGVRRRFMDMEIGQVHPGYLHDHTAIPESLAAAKQLLEVDRYLASASSPRCWKYGMNS